MQFVLAGDGKNAHGFSDGIIPPQPGRADSGDALFYGPTL
jgi:hypothetical protein